MQDARLLQENKEEGLNHLRSLQDTRQPDNHGAILTRQPDKYATRQPENQTIKQPDNQTTKQPDKQTTRQPDN